MSQVHGTAASTEESQGEVIAKKLIGVRQLILNRPKRLNALSLSMIKAIIPKVLAWNGSGLANIITLKGNGRALCAGGDVRGVVEAAKANDPNTYEYFANEYQLNHLVSALDTPYVSIMDGITMGGGIGISVHAPFRIATENTVFAMPETAIGLFPDVGGSFFLPRLDGQLGIYLGLTGAKLSAEDVLFAGIATHFVPSSRLEALETRLSELESSDYDIINTAIEEFAADYDPEVRFSLAGETRKAIDRCFKFNTVEEIIAALDKENTEWAANTKANLLEMSPTSLKITLQQLRIGGKRSIADCFKMEYKLAEKIIFSSEFHEGVTAKLINKTKPNWNPATLEDISNDSILKTYFESPGQRQLSLLSPKDYMQYPYRKYALPSEEDIRRVVTGDATDAILSQPVTGSDIIDWFVRERHGKFGVQEKVREVLERKTKLEGDVLRWIY
ncbi:ClpP/crotonase-like domain-containing protein [Umbelopsis sp. PMI_123]|nr:ClpP/crotonase-like domain-containing protein [Umbelopsis sp. PMI_123]